MSDVDDATVHHLHAVWLDNKSGASLKVSVVDSFSRDDFELVECVIFKFSVLICGRGIFPSKSRKFKPQTL